MFVSSSFFRQFLAVFSGTLSVVSVGIHSAWTSPYLPKMLNESTTEVHVTNEEGSWIAVMPLLGGCVGSFLILPMLDRYGRKFSILFWTPVMAATFLMLAFAKTVFLIDLSRFIAGCAQGSIYSAVPMYVAEVSHQKHRGSLTALSFILLRVGSLFINIIGPYTTIFVSSLVCFVIPVVNFIIFFWMPESPYYYLKKNMNIEAERSLKWLRGNDDVKEELGEISAGVRRQEGDSAAKVTDLFCVPSNRQGVIILGIATLAHNFSGKEPYQYYAITIFTSAEASITGHLAAVIYCLVDMFSIFTALLIVDKINRRTLVIFSMIGCTIFLVLEGTYFYLLKNDADFVEDLGWWPIVALIGYNVTFNLGLALSPLLLLGELFPTTVKTPASCLGELYWLSTAVVASKVFQFTADQYGMHMPFWTFAVCVLLFFPLIVKYLPETRGKSLEEIQLYLISGKKS